MAGRSRRCVYVSSLQRLVGCDEVLTSLVLPLREAIQWAMWPGRRQKPAYVWKDYLKVRFRPKVNA